jgi:hypothetical protein
MQKKEKVPFSEARRQLLTFIGFGAAATGLGAIVGSEKIFARQFTQATTNIELPSMAYDQALQVMVDPVTRRPIYEDARKLTQVQTTVTAGCSNCPKCDDYCS